MSKQLKAVLFDLDGVIVDTARYHYLAWKRIAEEEGIAFDEKANEGLKGVSRMASLDLILARGKKTYSIEQKIALADKKNAIYVDMIAGLRPDEILPGVKDFLASLAAAGVKRAICSASKNAPMILDRLGVTKDFDTVVSGNDTSRSKPDPEVFEMAAGRLGVPPAECLVVEDAYAGIQAAKAAGMKAVGIGEAHVLDIADLVYSGTAQLSLPAIKKSLFS
ncbi:MAG TPA: beta-phosphoglucomutase [bacterium]|nr:beta-phosphoglucomutase [bacterium]